MLISRKRYKIETYFQWKTNRKPYVAYRMAPVLVTLNDLEGHSPVAGLLKCNPLNICAVFYQISTDSASRGPSATAGLFVLVAFYSPLSVCLISCRPRCRFRINKIFITLICPNDSHVAMATPLWGTDGHITLSVEIW